MENSCRLLPLIKELLDSEKIPSLKWIDKEQQIWQLPWKHHRPTRWGEPDAYMLCEIARKMYNFRGHDPQPEDLKTWKERLRNALRSLGVKELEKLRQQDGENPIKVYQFSSSPVNGKRSKGTASNSRKQRNGNSPPNLEAFIPLSQFDDASQNSVSSQPPLFDPFVSRGVATSFRSRSPVHDFSDIDTDGFSGNLDSIPNNNSFGIATSLAESVATTNTCVATYAFRENSNIQYSPHLHNNLSYIAHTDFKQNTVDAKKVNEFHQYPQCEQLTNNTHLVGLIPQTVIDVVGNIPNCVSDCGSEDSSELPDSIEMLQMNFLLEPSLIFNKVDSSDLPYITLTVKYLNQTVVSKRIFNQSVKLCYVPDNNCRESIRNCHTPEQYGPNDAKLVELPSADTCPGIEKDKLVLIQSILNHMERGVTIVYKENDIFATRLCKAVPFYTIQTERGYKKLERGAEEKIFDFNAYFVPQLVENNKPNPYVRLTFSVRNPDLVRTPMLSVDIWHMEANELIQKQMEFTASINHLEPDCSLSNEFDTRLRIEHSLQRSEFV